MAPQLGLMASGKFSPGPLRPLNGKQSKDASGSGRTERFASDFYVMFMAHYLFYFNCVRACGGASVCSFPTLHYDDPGIQQLTERILAIFKVGGQTKSSCPNLLGNSVMLLVVRPKRITDPDLDDSREFLAFCTPALDYAVLPNVEKRPQAPGQGRVAELDRQASAWRSAGSELAALGLGGLLLAISSVWPCPTGDMWPSPTGAELSVAFSNWRYPLYLKPKAAIGLLEMRTVLRERRMGFNRRCTVPGNLEAREREPDCFAFREVVARNAACAERRRGLACFSPLPEEARPITLPDGAV